MQTSAAAVADIHIGAFTYRIHTLKNLYITGIVLLILHTASLPLSFISSLLGDKLSVFSAFVLQNNA
jgi:hypothetical protein